MDKNVNVYMLGHLDSIGYSATIVAVNVPEYSYLIAPHMQLPVAILTVGSW